jgi:hypothetical protein
VNDNKCVVGFTLDTKKYEDSVDRCGVPGKCYRLPTETKWSWLPPWATKSTTVVNVRFQSEESLSWYDGVYCELYSRVLGDFCLDKITKEQFPDLHSVPLDYSNGKSPKRFDEIKGLQKKARGGICW